MRLGLVPMQQRELRLLVVGQAQAARQAASALLEKQQPPEMQLQLQERLLELQERLLEQLERLLELLEHQKLHRTASTQGRYLSARRVLV